MSPRKRSRLFDQIVAGTLEVLEDRGLQVLPAAVESVLDGVVKSMAARMGVTPATALRHVGPESLADVIVKAPRRPVARNARPRGHWRPVAVATG
jgi:hypothetical protein